MIMPNEETLLIVTAILNPMVKLTFTQYDSKKPKATSLCSIEKIQRRYFCLIHEKMPIDSSNQKSPGLPANSRTKKVVLEEASAELYRKAAIDSTS